MYGLYWKVARAFVQAIGNPAVMRELTRVGMQSRPLMEWVLRIMANLLRPDELGPAEAAYKMVAAIVAVAPDRPDRTLRACVERGQEFALCDAGLGLGCQPPLTGGRTATSSPSCEDGVVAVGGLVAVDPDAGGVEHGGEVVAVGGAEVVEQAAEGDGVALVVRAARGLAGLGEQADPDAQRGAPSPGSTLVRAAGNASRRSGSIGSPVTSSMP